MRQFSYLPKGYLVDRNPAVAGGKEFMYRAASDAKSGVPKLEIVDKAQKTLEKISFTP